MAVSLDVIALTFCSSQIYNADKSVWRRWSFVNAGWHAGLLLFYLAVIDLVSVLDQYLGVVLELELPDFLKMFQPYVSWLAEKFRSHIVVYVSIFAMGYVWWQYCSKVVGEPTTPSAGDAPFFLRRYFRQPKIDSSDKSSSWFWHLSACLVAVDMLALAAVVKSGEKLIQFPQGFTDIESDFSALNEKIVGSLNVDFFQATLVITVAVYLIVALLCYLSAKLSNRFWRSIAASTIDDDQITTALFIVVTLRLLEPFVIFYFIIHSLAFLATGVPIHSPAFLLGSALLVAALIQYVGFGAILTASSNQVGAAAASSRGTR